jgi:hypothetical protein
VSYDSGDLRPRIVPWTRPKALNMTGLTLLTIRHAYISRFARMLRAQGVRRCRHRTLTIGGGQNLNGRTSSG